MNRPRILFASYHCFHDPSSGAALCTRDLFDLLSQRGWKCGVVTGPRLDFHQSGSLKQLLVNDLRYRALSCQEEGVAYTSYNSTGDGYPICLFEPESSEKTSSSKVTAVFLQFVERVLKRFRPNLLLTYGGDPASQGIIKLARQFQIPVVFWLHNVAYTSASCFSGCQDIIVPSQFTRRHYQALLGLNSTVLPGPWNPDRFLVNANRRQFVTFVNPEPYKGVFWFARIVEVLGRQRPDIPFLVVEGRGNSDWLGHCGLDLSGAKSVYRMKNTPNAREFYERTRLLLVPSLGPEGTSRVVVESMWNGIPVIGSGRGGLQETLSGGGIQLDIPDTYTPDSRTAPTEQEVQAWVDTIIRLWDNEKDYQQEMDSAHLRSREWHPDQLIPQWEKYLVKFS